jgi:hypothetical protein
VGKGNVRKRETGDRTTAHHKAMYKERPRKFKADYIGGHPSFPKKETDVYVYHDRIELEKMGLIIPVADIRHITTEDEEKIRKRRIVALGLIFLPLAILGAVWKKKFVYTVIEYRDALGDQEVVLDFGRHMNEAQPYIYQQVVRARTQL